MVKRRKGWVAIGLILFQLALIYGLYYIVIHPEWL